MSASGLTRRDVILALAAIAVWGLLDLLAHLAERYTARGPFELLLRRLTGA